MNETKEPTIFKITLPMKSDYILRSETNNEGESVKKRYTLQEYDVLRARGKLPEASDEIMYIEGYAEDTSTDPKGVHFTENCVVGMVGCINEFGKHIPVLRDTKSIERSIGKIGGATDLVGIDIEHSDKFTDEIGWADSAEARYNLTDEQKASGMKPPVMHVRAAIDLGMSHGRDLQHARSKGRKLGFSVYGKITDAWKEVNRSTGAVRQIYNKVNLKKVAITTAPANANAWLDEVYRSMNGVEMEERVVDTTETISRGEIMDNDLETEERELKKEADEVKRAAAIQPPVEEKVEADETKKVDTSDDADDKEKVTRNTKSKESTTPDDDDSETLESLSKKISALTGKETDTSDKTDFVARSVYDTDMEVYRSKLEILTDILGSFPRLLKKQEEEIIKRAAEMVEPLVKSFEEKEKEVLDLTSRLTHIESLGKGVDDLIGVGTNTAKEEGVVDLKNLSPADRKAVIKHYIDDGQVEKAIGVMLAGNSGSPRISRPLGK